MKFSFMQYLYDSILKYMEKSYFSFNKLNKILRGMIIEYFISLKSSVISFLPKNNILNFDSNYFGFIEEQNRNSKEKNKIIQ